jgi:hypothetical protein
MFHLFTLYFFLKFFRPPFHCKKIGHLRLTACATILDLGTRFEMSAQIGGPVIYPRGNSPKNVLCGQLVRPMRRSRQCWTENFLNPAGNRTSVVQLIVYVCIDWAWLKILPDQAMLSIPHCSDNRFTDSGKFVSPTSRPRSTPKKDYFHASGTHFC